MEQEILTTILRQSESDTLDFKRDQYRFAGGTDDDKAELLKDILAFANAWKTSDAHIVVGIEEKNGQMASVFGVTETLADHTVQQFVSGKTNRPIAFVVENVFYQKVQLTVIRISQHQRRPLWLKQDFRKLKHETVYLRRGSSTDIAKVDEIAEMGRADGKAGTKSKSGPSVQLEFEHVIQTVRLWPSFMSHKDKDVYEAHLLRVIIRNDGQEAAQYVEGSLSVLTTLLFDEIPRLLHTGLLGDSRKCITITNEAPINPKVGTRRQRQLILPGRRLIVHEVQIAIVRGLTDSDRCLVSWDVSADNSEIGRGERMFREIPIVDERT